MNKSELVAAVAAKAGLSKKDSEKAVNAAFEAVTEALVKGDKVQLGIIISELQLDIVCVVLVDIKDYKLFRMMGRDLSAEL